MRLTNLCDAIMISRPRVDQWIATGAFRAPDRVGNAMREWSTEDAVRILAMATIVDAGVDVRSAGAATQFDLPSDGFLVLLTGAAPIGGTTMPNPPKVPIAGFWRAIVSPRDLPGFLANPDVQSAHVVDLANLHERVRSALEKAGA